MGRAVSLFFFFHFYFGKFTIRLFITLSQKSTLSCHQALTLTRKIKMSLAQPLSGFWTKATGKHSSAFFFSQDPLEPLSQEKTLLTLLVQRQQRWSEWRLGTITALPGLIPHSASERVLSESLLNSRPPLTWQTSLTKGRESPTCSPQTFLMERGIWVLLGTWAECCWPPGDRAGLFPPNTYLLAAKSPPELHSESPSSAPVERKGSISQSGFLLPTLLLQKPQLHSSLKIFSLSWK